MKKPVNDRILLQMDPFEKLIKNYLQNLVDYHEKLLLDVRNKYGENYMNQIDNTIGNKIGSFLYKNITY